MGRHLNTQRCRRSPWATLWLLPPRAQVLKILQVLNEAGLLRDEHLDILWAATEAEGTFDVVKSNVFTMIEELAGNLSQVRVCHRLCACCHLYMPAAARAGLIQPAGMRACACACGGVHTSLQHPFALPVTSASV